MQTAPHAEPLTCLQISFTVNISYSTRTYNIPDTLLYTDIQAYFILQQPQQSILLLSRFIDEDTAVTCIGSHRPLWSQNLNLATWLHGPCSSPLHQTSAGAFCEGPESNY